MKSVLKSVCCLAACISLSACEKKFNPTDGAPPSTQAVQTGDMSLVTVDKPEQFPMVRADQIEAPTELRVTGSVNPDISREIPVISLASGRVVDIKARLGDDVRKGELLLQVQSPDITNAFDAYLKAVNDEQLANKAYIRAKDLYEHGAISLGILEQAEDTEKDAKADLNAAEEQLDTLGIKKDHPSSIVPVYAPISGVIISQNVTNAAAAGVTFSGSSTMFTIADLSVVWILCDVYENDLPKITLGQSATIRANAYPDKPLIGRISDIQPVLDPNIRTAKVRIEVANPGEMMRPGMFASITLFGKGKQNYAAVPASAIVHLHDRDWVYTPVDGKFKRIEVVSGDQLPNGMQEILSGLLPNQQVVTNAINLQNVIDNE